MRNMKDSVESRDSQAFSSGYQNRPGQNLFLPKLGGSSRPFPCAPPIIFNALTYTVRIVVPGGKGGTRGKGWKGRSKTERMSNVEASADLRGAL